jgi:Domain of unknown function (DUF4129)
VGILLLEALPVSAVLQTAAAIETGDAGAAALPLWYLIGVLIVARVVGRAYRRLNVAATIVAALPLMAASLLVAVRISPAGYGSVPGGPLDLAWLGTLIGDLGGSPRLGGVFGLILLVGYLWWRGLVLGRGVRTPDALRRAFTYGLAAIILAIALGAVVRGHGQAVLSGRLAFLLPVEVFCGLVTLALASARATGELEAGGAASTAGDRPWLSLALALAGIIVGIGLLLSLALSLDNVTAALVALGPLGALLSAGLAWLIYGFAYILYLLFNAPITYIINALQHASRPHVTQPPQPPTHACQNPQCLPSVPQAHGIAVAIVLGIVALVLIVTLVLLTIRALRALRDQAADLEQGEERESLDGRALLRAQLRTLLSRSRRARPESQEPLPASATRRIYLEVLRAAALAGLPRAPTETPDEYLLHLSSAAALAGEEGELAALTEAYDAARYGESEPDAARQRHLRALAERLRGRLRGRAREQGRV